MRNIKTICISAYLVLLAAPGKGQQTINSNADYLQKSWQTVATQMPGDWYGSAEAVAVADNLLFCQQHIGGWAKNKPYHHPLSKKDSIEITRLKPAIGATFDNGATVTEMRFLARVYVKTRDQRYRQSFEKGLHYIFEAQYKNGGWPQYYPFRKGESVDYASHITYNDNAMVNIMKLLKEIYEDRPLFLPLSLNAGLTLKAKQAFEKGVGCILRTQIRVDGRPTVWCAQHDEVTLAPANARAYELASFSGSESAAITSLLMEIKNPSPEIIQAIKGAVKWFEANKIKGIRLEKIKGTDVKENTVVVKDTSAPPIWARFYDLVSNRPFFCDRDGIKKYALEEIGAERRNGYSWYSYSPAQVLQNFGAWNKTVIQDAVTP